MVGICLGVSTIQNIQVCALVQYVQGLGDNYVKTFDDLVTLTLKLGSRCFVNGLILNRISDVRNFVLRAMQVAEWLLEAWTYTEAIHICTDERTKIPCV